MVRSGDLRVNVATAGDGPPVVLLHGFPDSWRLWRHQIDALAASGHRVIAPDLRGFGESDRPSGVAAYPIDLLIGDVVSVYADAGVERAALVGHDWGAALAWQIAMRRPDLVDRLAVLSVGHFGAMAGAGLAQRRLSWYMLWFQFPGVAEEVFPRHDWRFYREWASGGVPTGDAFLTEAQMRESGAFVDGPWRYERVEGDHWFPASNARRLNELLVDFLEPGSG